MQPFIYNHPITGDKTICIHTSYHYTKSFYSDDNGYYNKNESINLIQYLKSLLTNDEKSSNPVTYRHKYETGDFIISDNLA